MNFPRHNISANDRLVAEHSVGKLLDIDGTLHRIVAIVDDRYLLATTSTHQIYLLQDENGCIGLPTRAKLNELLISQRAVPVGDDGQTLAHSLPDRMRFQIELLDAHGVANGTKAIWLFLRRNWSSELIARYGAHDDAATIKKWRTETRRGHS